MPLLHLKRSHFQKSLYLGNKIVSLAVTPYPSDTRRGLENFHLPRVDICLGEATAMRLTEELRCTAAKLMNVGKLAVDSAVMESLKGGMQVYAIVKGKLKGQPSNGDKKQNSVLVEEMQAKLEKMQHEINDMNQQSETSILTTEGQEHRKQFFNEPIKNSMPEATSRRKIFIRSRL